MELAAEMFEQIVSRLGPARAEEPPPGAEDRRRAARWAVSADVLVAPFGVNSAKPRKVKLTSISRGGAAIVDEFTRPPGTKMILFLPRPDGGMLPVVCQIMNTRMTGDEFRLGMQFLSQSEQDAATQITRSVRTIVNNAAAESPVAVLERIATSGVTRGGPDRRVELNVHGVMIRDAGGAAAAARDQDDAGDTPPGAPTIVNVKDISTAGYLCIVHDEEMSRSERFTLQIPSQPRPLTMRCTVLDNRRDEDGKVRIDARFEMEGSGGDGGLLGRMRRWFAA